MGPRKRAGKGPGDKTESDERPVRRKVTPPSGSEYPGEGEGGSWSCGPGLCAFFILTVLLTSGGIYTHYYVGFDNVLDVVSNSVATLFHEEVCEHDELPVPVDIREIQDRERQKGAEEIHDDVLQPSETSVADDKDSAEKETMETQDENTVTEEDVHEQDKHDVETPEDPNMDSQIDDVFDEQGVDGGGDTGAIGEEQNDPEPEGGRNDGEEVDTTEHEIDPPGTDEFDEIEELDEGERESDYRTEAERLIDTLEVLSEDFPEINAAEDEIAEESVIDTLEELSEDFPESNFEENEILEETSEAHEDHVEDNIPVEETAAEEVFENEQEFIETRRKRDEGNIDKEEKLEEETEPSESFCDTREDDGQEDEVVERQQVHDDGDVPEEKSGEDFSVEEDATKAEQGREEETDEGYETAEEDRDLSDNLGETEKVQIEPIEIEFHHHDAAAQTHDGANNDDFMEDAFQEPSIDIHVEIHKPEIIEPEVLPLEDDFGQDEVESARTTPAAEAPKVEQKDEFSEFDEEFEDEELVKKQVQGEQGEMGVNELQLEKEDKLSDDNTGMEDSAGENIEEDIKDNDQEASDAASQTKTDDPGLVHNQENTEERNEEEREDRPEENTGEDEDTFTGSETAHISPREEETPVEETKPHYRHADITNSADNKIRTELDRATDLSQAKRADEALEKFEGILSRYPKSPRAQYGKAQALDVMSELKKSNAILEESITEYEKVLEMDDLPPGLFLLAGRRLADRQLFRGWGSKGLKTRRRLLDKFPDDVSLWNEFGVSALTIGRVEDARQAFQGVLDRDAENGFALVHMGFILKTTDTNYEQAVPLLKRGIESDAPGVIDGRFFFHLGDAQYRLGNHTAAYETYELGTKKGLFRSLYQRSLYNVDHLTPRAWWTPEETGNEEMLKMLEENWEVIREEGVNQLDETGSFRPEEENLRESGDWKQFTLFQQGRRFQRNCDKAPKTCALLENFGDAVGCRRGQVKFSVMHPGIHVWPHCGPTNCRIRSHLGLVIPEGPKIRVANESRTWKEGEFIIFDDSFEHEVWWQEGEQSGFRLVLIVDMWHPELTDREKRTLSAI